MPPRLSELPRLLQEPLGPEQASASSVCASSVSVLAFQEAGLQAQRMGCQDRVRGGQAGDYCPHADAVCPIHDQGACVDRLGVTRFVICFEVGSVCARRVFALALPDELSIGSAKVSQRLSLDLFRGRDAKPFQHIMKVFERTGHHRREFRRDLKLRLVGFFAAFGQLPPKALSEIRANSALTKSEIALRRQILVWPRAIELEATSAFWGGFTLAAISERLQKRNQTLRRRLLRIRHMRRDPARPNASLF